MTRQAVIFAPWFGVNSGGAEIALLKIAEGLRDLGCAVEIYTSKSLRPYADWLENPPADPAETCHGFPVRRFDVDRAGFERFLLVNQAVSANGFLQAGAQDDFFRYGLTSSALIEALKALPDSTILVGGPYYQAMLHNAVAALPGRITIMPAFHDEPPFHFAAVNRLIGDARAVLFLTETEKTMAIACHGDAMSRAKFETPVLSLPFIDETAGTEPSEPGIARRLMERYLLYVGRIDEGKNIRQLIQWHHEVNEQRQSEGHRTVPLLLAGKGVETGLNSPHVRQLGYVTEADKDSLISGAWGLVNLSRNESFSFVLFEAWQRGVPVIVHQACRVMRDHIDRSRGGYACDNAWEYAAAIRQFENPDLREVLARNGRAYAQATCDRDGFLRRLSRILEIA